MSRTLEATPQAANLFIRAGWFLLNALQLAFTLAWSAGWITAALLVRLATRDTRLPLRMAARCWAPGLLAGAGARVTVEGAESVDWEQPCLIVANHRSIIDICALYVAVPVPLRFILKEELGRVPFLGGYARAMGMVFLRRRASHRTAANLDSAGNLLRDGNSLCAFPEGSRGHDDTVGRFRGGAFHVAVETGVPVVPVSLTGTGDILPAGGFQVRPGRIHVRFGAPIDPGADRRALAERARAAVVANLGQAVVRADGTGTRTADS